jgi:hypothetical protein
VEGIGFNFFFAYEAAVVLNWFFGIGCFLQSVGTFSVDTEEETECLVSFFLGYRIQMVAVVKLF